MCFISNSTLKFLMTSPHVRNSMYILSFKTNLANYYFAGLKKVTADMQTHKNPNLRNPAPVGKLISHRTKIKIS